MEKELFEVRDLRDKAFFMVDDRYLNGWARRCGPYASLVYIVLCRHAGKDQQCFPSISLISQKLDISERQVIRALSILEEFHIIKTDRASGRNNLYYLLDKKEWLTEAWQASDSQSPVTIRHHTSDSQSPKLVTDSHTKDIHRRKQKKDIVPDFIDTSFGRFYSSYPKHEGKQQALSAWRRLCPTEDFLVTILQAIEKQKAHKAHLKATNQFCPEWPMPASWLNGRRWEDEIPDTSQSQRRLAY